MNVFFKDAIKALDIWENTNVLTCEDLLDPVDNKLIKKFETHHSILKIKETTSETNFPFSTINREQLEKEVQISNTKKKNYL